MKKFLILLFVIFICSIAHADTETINWYVDGNTYATTTCEIGGGVTLPNTPYKYGYTFQGWNEFFYRGQFQTFYAVPQNTSLYQPDINGNNVPQEGDYILVEDAYDYLENPAEITYANKTGYKLAKIEFTYFDSYTGITDIQTVSFNLAGWYSPQRTVNDPVSFNGRILFYVTAGDNEVYITPIEPLIVNGNIIHANERVLIVNGYASTSIKGTILFSQNASFLSGSWRFVYRGSWEQDEKNGWKPQYEINQ